VETATEARGATSHDYKNFAGSNRGRRLCLSVTATVRTVISLSPWRWARWKLCVSAFRVTDNGVVIADETVLQGTDDIHIKLKQPFGRERHGDGRPPAKTSTVYADLATATTR
jgi:hypothetical protein